CPNTGSIACLLLTSIGSEEGPSGGKILSKTTFIQRLNTAGGSAPADGCSTSADGGNQGLVPYTADYLFFNQQSRVPKGTSGTDEVESVPTAKRKCPGNVVFRQSLLDTLA